MRSHLIIAYDIANLQPNISYEGQYGVAALRLSVQFFENPPL